MSRWFNKLNAEQRKAVRAVEGPLLVLAGAGSGKTRVITHRIAYMIEQGIAPKSILALTFTNKAAGEMKSRLREMMGKSAEGVTLSTFHSLGLHILKSEAARAKRRQRLTIFDAGDQIATLRDLLRQHRFERSFDLGSLLSRISGYKNDFIKPGEVPWSDDPYDEVAGLLYPLYVEALEAYGAVDFDDLVCMPAAKMYESTAFRKRWADQYRYVLVDEYQDTNGSQMRLLKGLAAEHKNVCVVGDDDQSIYGWRGAEVKNILNFGKDFPGALEVHLMKNYRSRDPVLELANLVISENLERYEKSMAGVRGSGTAVKMLIAPDGGAEMTWVGQFLQRMAQEKRYRLKDMAVLYRSNIMVRELETELRGHGLHYRVLGGQAFFERKEVKDLLAYLRLCYNSNDEISLRRCINTPTRGIGPKSVAGLTAWADENGCSMYKATSAAAEIFGVGDRQAVAVARFRELIDGIAPRMRRSPDLAGAVEELVRAIGLRDNVQEGSASAKAVERGLGIIDSFIASLRQYQKSAEYPSLGDYLQRISLFNSNDNAEDEKDDRITLSTLHGSKGLEFPLVVLVGAEEGFLPHDRTLNPHENDHVTGEVAEERRLFYVGVTRAMDELVITRTLERLVRGKMQPRTPSRFLECAPEGMFAVEDLSAEPSESEVKANLADLRAMLSFGD